MQRGETIILQSTVEAILIPDGLPLTLEKDSQVVVTQTLGDTFTVMTDRGFLARIAGKDAPALGMEVPKTAAATKSGAPTRGNSPLEQQIWDVMQTCYDPEIPVSIVELGLIYKCDLHEMPDGQNRVDIDMTLTAPGCGMGDILKMDVQQKVADLEGVTEVNVEMVFDPPWNPEMMSEETRLDLGLL